MKKNNIKKLIGFSHGVLYRVHDVHTKKNIQLFKDCGCNAIEVNFHMVEEFSGVLNVFPFVQSFDYISLHAPCNF